MCGSDHRPGDGRNALHVWLIRTHLLAGLCEVESNRSCARRRRAREWKLLIKTREIHVQRGGVAHL